MFLVEIQKETERLVVDIGKQRLKILPESEQTTEITLDFLPEAHRASIAEGGHSTSASDTGELALCFRLSGKI